MRSINKVIVIAALVVLSSVPVRAEVWDEHAYPDLGFAVRFPVNPQVASGTFETLNGDKVPATIYSAREGNSIYTMTVAEFANSSADTANAIADAVSQVRKSGEIKLDVNARINRQFGRELSVAENDGSRSTMGIFFFNNRLYELKANVLPPDPEAGSADALRFQQSLRFTGDAGRGFGRGGFGRGGPGRGGRGRGGRFGPPNPPPGGPI